MKRYMFRTTMLLAIILILHGAAACYASSEDNNLQNACVWLTDDGYWFVEDIEAEGILPVKIAEFYNGGEWPVLGRTGERTSVALKFIISGCGGNYAKITEDGNLYFISDISSDFEKGTLYKADLNRIDSDLQTNSIVKIDSDVNCQYGVSKIDSDKGIYLKDSGELRYYEKLLV